MNKNDLIKGIDLDDIYDFVDNGNPENAPNGIVEYLDLMNKVRSMDNRPLEYGTKESVLKHLIKVDNLTRHIATKLYYNTLEYFYASDQLSKQAQRNVYAAKIERMIAICEPFVKNVADAKQVVNMIKEAWRVRLLDKEDVEKIPEDWFKEQTVLYTTDILEAGLPPINRNELKDIVKGYPGLTEREIDRVLQEGLVTQIEIFPDEQKNARKA